MCVVEGIPSPSVVWKSNTTILESTRGFISTISNRVATARIESSFMERNGIIYICNASNVAGFVEQEFIVEMSGKFDVDQIIQVMFRAL